MLRRARHRNARASLLAVGVTSAALGCAISTFGVAIAQPPASAEAGRTFLLDLAESTIEESLLRAQPATYRPVGTTSSTYQVDLAGSIDAAFKPETRIHPRGWLAEVAAFRVGRALGLDSIPPAVVRPVERGQLRRRLVSEQDTELPSELTVTGGVIRGAFIYWVPNLQRTDLDQPEGIARWRAWLAQGGEIPDASRDTARDLSDMILFDYLIGNRDRWSGGNVRPVPSGRVVIRDHNLAFPSTIVEAQQQRMIEVLTRVQRFSRRTVSALRALDADTLASIVADEAPSSLLDERQREQVLARRETLLSYVGALVEAYGEDAVLFFP